MRANGIVCTSGSGGTGPLTLAALSSGLFNGSPQFTDVFGTSGTQWVEYSIVEYTDSTLQTIKQFEQGVGSLALSTNVLTRSKIESTWVAGTGYLPKQGSGTAPYAINAGSTAANVRVYCSPLANSSVPAVRWMGSSNSFGFTPDNAGLGSHHLAASSSASFAAANTTQSWMVPHLFEKGGLISSASVGVSTAGSSGAVARCGIYQDDGTGWAGSLLVDFGATAEFDLTSTGLKTTTLATPILIEPGWYWVHTQLNGTSTEAALYVASSTAVGNNPLGTTFALNTPIPGVKSTTLTYGALPSTAPAASNFTTQNAVYVAFK